KLTLASSPKLRTQERGHLPKAKLPTQEERVAAEMEEIQKHPFRARPLDRRIFESTGELGVPKVAARAVTEPVEFSLQVDRRSAQPRVRAPPAPVAQEPAFRAKPAPSQRRTATVAAAAAAQGVFKPTIPVSPKLRGGRRAASAPVRRQLPHPSATAAAPKRAPACKALTLTQPKAFQLSTSSRGEGEKQRARQQQEQDALDLAEARKVKAQPAPDFSRRSQAVKGEQKEMKPLTEVKPFQLRSSIRHKEAVASFQRESSSLAERESRESSGFHALPLPQTTYTAETERARAAHALVVPLPMQLQSGLRAAKRADFNQEVGEKQAKLEDVRNTLTKQQQQRESLEVQEWRRRAVEEGGLMFKAKPIGTADQYPSKAPPATPLTTPFSPKLLTKARSCMKEARHSVPLAALPLHKNTSHAPPHTHTAPSRALGSAAKPPPPPTSSPRARSSFATPAPAKTSLAVFGDAAAAIRAATAATNLGPAIRNAAANAAAAVAGEGAGVRVKGDTGGAPASASKLLSPCTPRTPCTASKMSTRSSLHKCADEAGAERRDAALTQALQAL
ncbi:hypothetical protein B484DRAFT_405742, partial [Ochromonadaceae sp. CCMP2298]